MKSSDLEYIVASVIGGRSATDVVPATEDWREFLKYMKLFDVPKKTWMMDLLEAYEGIRITDAKILLYLVSKFIPRENHEAFNLCYALSKLAVDSNLRIAFFSAKLVASHDLWDKYRRIGGAVVDDLTRSHRIIFRSMSTNSGDRVLVDEDRSADWIFIYDRCFANDGVFNDGLFTEATRMCYFGNVKKVICFDDRNASCYERLFRFMKTCDRRRVKCLDSRYDVRGVGVGEEFPVRYCPIDW